MAFQFNQGDRPLDGYTIQRGVGRGGFGEVYYALSDGGKEVALKFLRENPAVELRGVSHCLNLKSPYLVGIHDIRQNEHNDWFVVMEYVNGPSLRDLMNAEPGGLGPQKAAYFLREVAKGMAYLHDRGIVHRDLKPGNIFYEDGYVKIGDYGLAKLMSASQHSGQTVSVGTVHYMAPEVGSGNYDRTIDIYALGVMLYEMLLGRVPFSGATMGEVLMKHLTAQPEVDELPAPFPHVIRKALAKDPKDRYQAVQEMVSELFAVKSLDDSVSAFEPASLSTIAAKAAAQMHARHAAESPGGVATLTGVGGSSNIGRLGTESDDAFTLKVDRRTSQGRFGRLQQRIGARVDRVAERIDGTSTAQQINRAVSAPGSTAAKVLIAVILAVGVSFGVSILAAGSASRLLFATVVFLNIAAIVQGVAVGTWLSYERLRIAGIWVPRLIIAALAAAGLLGAGEFASLLRTTEAVEIKEVASAKSSDGESIVSVGVESKDGETVATSDAPKSKSAAPKARRSTTSRRVDTSKAEHWAGALILCLIFGDWAGRYYAGRQGVVSTGSAFSIGLFGFVAGIPFARGEGFTIAIIAAAASLIVQAVGSMWPLPPGAVIPKTCNDDEDEKEEEDDEEASDSPAPVAVEPPGFARTPAGASGLRRPKDKSAAQESASNQAVLAPDRSETDPRLRRSSAVRAFWLLASAFALCVSIILYATPHLVDKPLLFPVWNKERGWTQDFQIGVFTILGSIVGALFLYCFTRSWSAYRRGIWRGLIRPAIFFGGVALSACSGIAMGMLDIEREFIPLALGGILLGGIFSIFVWFVPVSAYRPYLPQTPEEAAQERARQGRRQVKVGGILFGMTAALCALLAVALPPNDVEEIVPVLAVLGGVLFIPMMAYGAITARRAMKKPLLPKPEKLSLPLRKVFEVDPHSNIVRLIERHMGVFGYKLASKSDLLWSFERGNWAAQFWQSDIRQWKVKFNIAAYELDNGGYRVTCYVEADAGFIDPDQKQIAALLEEIMDLQGLLGGREVPSGSGELKA